MLSFRVKHKKNYLKPNTSVLLSPSWILQGFFPLHHVSHFTCLVSNDTCLWSHIMFIFFSSSKRWSWLVNGLLLKGPTLSSFFFLLFFCFFFFKLIIHLQCNFNILGYLEKWSWNWSLASLVFVNIFLSYVVSLIYETYHIFCLFT